MTRPITTAPADTARAMHAAEMRGQDMQDAIKSRVTDEDMHESGRYFMECFRDVASCSHGDTGDYNNPYDGSMIAVLWNAHRAGTLITEAECQRRVDAAVQAERDACAWTSQSFLVGDPKNGIPLRSPMPSEIADAIRARGQK